MPISIVAHQAAGSTNDTSTTIPAINTTGADLLIAYCCSYSVASAPTITDSAGHTWPTPLRNVANGNNRISVRYLVSPTTQSSHTVTAALSQSYPTLIVVALSGILTGDPEGGSATETSGASGTSRQVTSFTPDSAGCLVLTTVCREGGTSNLIDAGFTVLRTVDYVTSEHFMGGLAYLLQTTPVPASPTWSWTTSASNLVIAEAWQPVPGETRRLFVRAS